MSELKVNKVTPRSGTTVTLGDSGDTITIPSGATITNSGTATGFGETNTPLFYVKKTSTQSIGDNTFTLVTWDSEIKDTNNAFSSNKFTAPSAGTYLFNSKIRVNSVPAGFTCQIVFYKNGSELGETQVSDFAASGASRDMEVGTTSILSLSTNDFIEVYGLITGSAALSLQTDAQFSGFKIIE
jgi:hypothetical protein